MVPRVMRSIGRLIAILAVIGATAAASPATSGKPNSLGSFDKWRAFASRQDGHLVCYMVSSPVKKEGQYKARGDSYVMVSIRPDSKPFGVVNIEAGYLYKEGSEVEVIIGDKKFRLFTHNRPKNDQGQAWAQNDDDDKALTAAIKAGKAMVVRGTSAKGSVTTDTYSLSGAIEAYRAIAAACKIKAS